MSKINKIFFIVEGDTELDFVKKILIDEFYFSTAIIPIKINKTQGGLVHYSNLKKDILKYVSKDNALITTFIDLYALPDDFPKYSIAKKESNVYKKVEIIENGIKSDIEQTVGKEVYNFIPYIQIHEFETLLFSDVEKFNELYDNEVVKYLQHIVLQFKNNPELINERKETAPSKRILKVMEDTNSEFKKTIHGFLLAEEIGIDIMRQRCKHFNKWIKKLLSFLD